MGATSQVTTRSRRGLGQTYRKPLFFRYRVCFGKTAEDWNTTCVMDLDDIYIYMSNHLNPWGRVSYTCCYRAWTNVKPGTRSNRETVNGRENEAKWRMDIVSRFNSIDQIFHIRVPGETQPVLIYIPLVLFYIYLLDPETLAWFVLFVLRSSVKAIIGYCRRFPQCLVRYLGPSKLVPLGIHLKSFVLLPFIPQQKTCWHT